MNITRLKERLEEEGCPAGDHAIGSRGQGDTFCLMYDGRMWNVFYSEREIDSSPIFISESESEACEFFLEHMLKQPNLHLVGAFTSDAEAEAFEKEAVRLGATPIRNDLPKSMLAAHRFRVFVAGRDIHKVTGR